MKSEEVFQQFILASKELTKEAQTGDAKSDSLSPYERWKKVERALELFGFSLMCNQHTIAGVPTAVIVGMPADCIPYLQMKDCFYELVAKYNLLFGSGDWYAGEFDSRASKSVISDENYRALIKFKIDEQWFNEHHGKWVGIVGGKLVAEAESEDAILNKLETNYAGQEGFCSQILTREEEDEKAICIP